MDTLKILVVDDESEMRRAVERALSRFTVQLPDVEGEVCFAVSQAASGEKALELVAADPPDILLLDHKMEGMTGLEVLDHISKQEYEMLTVMITAYASLETAVVATKRGAFDFVAKPFTPAELKETVRKAASHLIVQRQARKLAQEKRQVRFQFISVLAHELKAPLGAIEGFLQALSNPAVRENPDACVQMINRCLARSEGMRKMITDLLDMTRIESGTKKREIGDVDMVEVVRTSIETVAPQAEAKNITIDLQSDASVMMVADRGELEIIANNLLSNAVKYNRRDGRVDVTLRAEGDTVIFRVADTGIGMTAEEAAKLFNDFVRIKNDKTRQILGSGLGLSIVKKLAALYEGQTEVKSEPDVGSTFTVRLKRETKGAADHAEASRDTELAAGK